MIWSLCPLGYAHELDLLEIRFAEQASVVDRFVVSEAAWNYNGKAKAFHLDLSDERWAPWRDKVTVVRVEDEPNWNLMPHQNFGIREHWQRENHQRRALGRELDVHPHDTIHVSDLDEILKAETLLRYDEGDYSRLVHPQLPMHRHFLNLHWRDRIALSIARLCRGHTLIGFGGDVETLRWADPSESWLLSYWNAYTLGDYDFGTWGWHFSWMGGPEAIAAKLRLAAHPEELSPRNRSKASVLRILTNGEDLQGLMRPLFWIPDSRLPAHALDERFAHLRCGPEYATPDGSPERAVEPNYHWRG